METNRQDNNSKHNLHKIIMQLNLFKKVTLMMVKVQDNKIIQLVITFSEKL